MINEYKKIKFWNAATVSSFKAVLVNLSDDEKCRLTEEIAIHLTKTKLSQNICAAQELLAYATEKYNDITDSNVKAMIFYRLGELYEKHYEDFKKAFSSYEKYALLNTKHGGVHSLLLRAILLKDDFTYSPELEKELRMSYGEIDLGLRSDRLFENIGSLIVARNEGEKNELCKEYTKRIKNIVKADELLFPDFIFKKDTVRDVLEVPQKVFDFVNSL